MYDVKAFMDGGTYETSNGGRTFRILFDRPGTRVDKVVFHPMYDHGNFQYDLAVLRLVSPVRDQTPITLIDRSSESRFEIKLLIN